MTPRSPKDLADGVLVLVGFNVLATIVFGPWLTCFFMAMFVLLFLAEG